MNSGSECSVNSFVEADVVRCLRKTPRTYNTGDKKNEMQQLYVF